MLFNSISFLIFFPTVVLIYYSIPHRFRHIFLLISSCYFYMVFVPKYIFVLLYLITTDYFLAKTIEKKVGPKRKIFLILSIVVNLGTLFIFKYFNFFNLNLAALANLLHWNYSPLLFSIILPLGLSFHIFQSLSYVIEVYRGRYKAENNFFMYALYVMFFPQLVAGPIERPQNLLPQFKPVHYFDFSRVKNGLERMLWGFFKKIVIADNLASYVNQIYGHPQGYSGIVLVVATFFFAFQVYCDFSGYSDIALGSAKVLGFKLIENFDRPFLSRSIADFWRKWHISLSSWLRDYLYYPIVLGSKGDMKIRIYFSLLVTFVLIGLWHGANWTFVAFGAIHGTYMIFGLMTESWRKRLLGKISWRFWPRLRHLLQVLLTFILVCFGFVFFRANTFADAYYVVINSFYGLMNILQIGIGSLFSLNFGPLSKILQTIYLPIGRIHFIVFLAGIFAFLVIEILDLKMNLTSLFSKQKRLVRWFVYIIAVISIMNLGVTKEIPFIYFQF